jgi:multiple sugar transport system ATP-binding protein
VAGVTLNGVTKEFENGFRAVEDLTLDIADGEFLVMVGPSGCGKSTTLRMIAGLEAITEGEITIGDRIVNDLHPKDRDIAMVFQNYALYPHMTVRDNIGFPLKVSGVPREERTERVEETAALLDLTEQLDKKPGKLSGGQRQRVAMGRAIIRTPQVFLLDEPLSNLDAKLRVQMRADITELQRRVGVTTFYVTHDQTEAMTMADRVAVINNGILQQVAPPQVLFEQPDNLFLAAFIGSPSMALLEARLVSRGGEHVLEFGPETSLAVPSETFDGRERLREYVDRPVVIGLRPKDFRDVSDDTEFPAAQRFTSTVFNLEALGHERMVYFTVEAKARIADEVLIEDGDVIVADHGAAVAARLPGKSGLSIGDRIEVGVDIASGHFFDPADGLAIRD